MPPLPDLGPKPRLGYTQSVIDRAAERRHDAAALAQAPNARAYVIGNETIVLKTHGGATYEPAFTLDEARALGAAVVEPVFLGLQDQAPRFGFGLPASAIEALPARTDLFLTDLRSVAVQGLVAPEHLPPLAEAKALLHWHIRHRFCANCGMPTNVSDGGWRRDCPSCEAQHFPRTDPVAIMLTIDGDRCLLGRSARFASTMWSCLAGFVEPGEAIEDAVRRETLEEAGIVCGEVRYFASQPWPFPSSLMIGCHAQALSRDIKIDANELEDARWFTRDEIISMLLRRHPDGLALPPPVAIAHHIIRAWIEDDVSF
ncbi:MAG: diphosphatase [Xanthobacteraceae bacterium]|nr:diphosphatase [Xanthobacteraceae bacterium]